MLQESTKQRIRVHMGVPVLGVQNSGFSLGYRFTNVMGLLEYRMINMQPFEEASITGVPAAMAMVGPGTPVAGDTLTLTVNALAPITYTVTSQDVLSTDPLGTVSQNFANQINANSTLNSTVVATFAPSKTQPAFNTVAPNATLILQALSATVFTISCSFSGHTNFVAYMQGTLPAPYSTFQEDGLTLHGYVPICDYLQGKTASASDLLKFAQADVTKFRPDELGARAAVYKYWCKQLAQFLGIPLNPMPPVGNFGGGNTGLVA